MAAIENYGGCDALNEKIPYRSSVEVVKDRQSAGKPKWANGKVCLLIVAILSLMDMSVLVTIFDKCFTQSAWMVVVMSLGVAVTLNVLPMIIARLVHASIEKTSKEAKYIMGILIAGFILLYAGTVYLRFGYKDMYGQENQSEELVNTASDDYEAVEEAKPVNNEKANCVVILLSICPLITSLLGFAISYISDDEMKAKLEANEIALAEREHAIIECETAIAQMESFMEYGKDNEIEADYKSMIAAKEEVVARCELLKALARYYLAEYLADPQATSMICQEMILNKEDSEDVVMGDGPDFSYYRENEVNKVS